MIRTQKGNVFVILLAAISMVGLISYGIYNLMGGPIAGINAINQKTLAETQIIMAAELLATKAVNSTGNGDCDNDNYVELPVWRTGSGPTNGGLLPNTVGGSLVDPWGSQYGYCVWDMGGTSDDGDGSSADGDCGRSGNQLDGNNAATSGNIEANLVMAIVSAGPNRTFNSSCAAYTNGTTAVFTPGGDDVYKAFTYGEAAKLSAGGASSYLWFLKTSPSPDSTTAQVTQNIAIGSGITVNSAGAGVFGAVSADEMTTINSEASFSRGGHFVLGTNATVDSGNANCNASNIGLLRYNTTINDAQVCMLHGGASTYAWRTVGSWSDQADCDAPNGWSKVKSDYICTTRYFTAYRNTGTTVNAYSLSPTNGKAYFIFNPSSTAGNLGMLRAAYHTDGTQAELSSGNIGSTSLAMGKGAKASGLRSIALGSASTSGNAVLGVATVGPRATGTDSIALGTGATASATGSLAIGETVTASGNNCVAIGINSSCTAAGLAIGDTVSSATGVGIAIGYNVSTSAGDAIALSANGGGTANSNVDDIYVYASGRILINAASSADTTHTFQVHGPVWGPATTWTAISDARLKNVLYDYDKGLDALATITPKYFYYKEGNPFDLDTDTQHLGLIAQEVKGAFPEAVLHYDNGYMSIDPEPIFIARVNAFKDLKRLNESLENEIKLLTARIEVLEKETASLPDRPSRPAQSYIWFLPALVTLGAGGWLRHRRKNCGGKK